MSNKRWNNHHFCQAVEIVHGLNVVLKGVQFTGPNGTTKFFDMLLDTGAAYTSIPHESFTLLGLAENERTQKIVFGNNVELDRPFDTVPLITVEQISVANIDVMSLPSKIGEFRGVIGGSFLKHVGLYLQLDRRIVHFYYD
jgi:hypothetical protein